MTAHLTAAQARALARYLTPDQIERLGPVIEHAPRRTTRRAVPRDRAVSVCHTCGATFDTDAAETRHVAATSHARYDCDTDGA